MGFTGIPGEKEREILSLLRGTLSGSHVHAETKKNRRLLQLHPNSALRTTQFFDAGDILATTGISCQDDVGLVSLGVAVN